MIIFVHGVGMRDPWFWIEWKHHLEPQLHTRGIFLEPQDFRGVFYGDLAPSAKPAYQSNAGQLYQLALSEFKKHQSLFSKVTASLEGLAEAVVSNFSDIISYLDDTETHFAINNRLYQTLSQIKKRITLIGYSLGSLVCYCSLQEHPEYCNRVDNLILVGSPLFWFKEKVVRHADLDHRPAVGRFVNLAGIWDIAWPQKLPALVAGVDEPVEFLIDPVDPIRGHRRYFKKKNSLALLAGIIAKGSLGARKLPLPRQTP